MQANDEPTLSPKEFKRIHDLAIEKGKQRALTALGKWNQAMFSMDATDDEVAELLIEAMSAKRVLMDLAEWKTEFETGFRA